MKTNRWKLILIVWGIASLIPWILTAQTTGPTQDKPETRDYMPPPPSPTDPVRSTPPAPTPPDMRPTTPDVRSTPPEMMKSPTDTTKPPLPGSTAPDNTKINRAPVPKEELIHAQSPSL